MSTISNARIIQVRDVEAANAMLRRDLAARIIGGPPIIEPIPVQPALAPVTALPPTFPALVAAAPNPAPAPVAGVPVRVEDGVFLVHPNVAEKYCVHMPCTVECRVYFLKSPYSFYNQI